MSDKTPLSRADIVGLLGDRLGDNLRAERSMAEVEYAAAEKALTEAANELALLDDGGKRGLAGHSKSSASAITHRHAVAVIRARAEAYRQERGEHGNES